MPVNDPREDYAAMLPKWQRCRDCFEGSDAVKARGAAYLPPLASHKTTQGGVSAEYQAYLQRATFYNATRRTVQGLAGAIFQKPLALANAEGAAVDLADVTMTGSSLEAFALEVGREELITGAYGILVDFAENGQRPFWVLHRAEDIVNWRTERIDGRQVLTLVVLCERYEETPTDEAIEADPDSDPFESCTDTQYRVLRLAPLAHGGPPVYQISVYREAEESGQKGGTGWVRVPQLDRIPTRGGEPLGFIPFVFDPMLPSPPLLDLVDMNLAHYRNSADLEHGLHHTGVPQLVISGANLQVDEQGHPRPLRFGPGEALILDVGGKAEILQADGAMLGALDGAEEKKRKLMATLGARLLEEQPASPETATGFLGRHSGEQASLRTIVREMQRDLTRALQVHIWWSAAGRTMADPAAIPVSVSLNQDFLTIKASPAELAEWMELLQAEKISEATFYDLLKRGGVAREGVTLEQEREDIASDAQAKAEREQARLNAEARTAMTAALNAGMGDPDAGASGLPAPEKIADQFLNGAQIKAASDIVAAVANGDIPRDSGIGQLQVLLRLSPEDAEQVMGSAGTSKPTTPNPNPAEVKAA